MSTHKKTQTVQQVVLATNNPGKIQELTEALRDTGIHAVGQDHVSLATVAETGMTFIENALIKARHAATVTGLPAMADDSGLCVDYLLGAPGVFSARYAGEAATAEDNINKLLSALAEVPAEKRRAQFYCVLVFLQSPTDPAPLISVGQWEGSITTAPSGTSGFGYDPIFYVPALRKTAAELSLAEKNAISHRGKALRDMVKKITSEPRFIAQ